MVRSVFAFLLVVATACQPAGLPDTITATAPRASPPASPPVPTPSDAELFTVNDGQRTLPAPFVGRWDATVDACDEQYSDMRLTIDDKNMKFWESDATPVSVKPDGVNAIALDAALSGEGDTWNDKFRMALVDAGKTLMIDDVKRVRCPLKE